jgi:hypothetical protein
MSRDALPPVPAVLGEPARYDGTTFARTWPERRVTWTPPVVRAPLVRSQDVTDTSAPGTRDMPQTARAWLARARTAGWRTHVTYALGWEVDADGAEACDTLWAETGETTDEGRARRTKVGSVPRAAVPSFLVRARHDRMPEFFAAGMWLNGKWFHGFTHIRGEGLKWSATAKPIKEFMDEVNRIAESQGDMPEGQLSLLD